MSERNEGAEFLRQRYPELARSTEVKAAANRTTFRTGTEVLKDPDVRIQNYLDRFNEIVVRPEPASKAKGITALKQVLFDRFVVRVEDIPDSYWQAQLRVVRNRGEGGDWQDLPEEEILKLKNDHLARSKEDQKGSIEEWIDYLASDRSAYLPDHLKYWAFAGMLRLERYEKAEKNTDGIVVKQGRFPERPTGRQRSVKMFPEVNENGLKFIASAYKLLAAGKSIYWGYNDDIPENARGAFQDALAKKDFRAAYGWVQEHIPPITYEEMQITEGDKCGWRTFSKEAGDTGQDVALTLVGKGTGWCIAGKETAQGNYLDQGAKLHIYYTRDKDGAQTNPRVVIVEMRGEVTEVRGIEWEENVDDHIKPTNVIGDMLKQLPGGKHFFATDADTKRLTALDRKISSGEPVTVDDLTFLYEIYRPIEYFGYSKDPRIEELKKQRSLEEHIQLIYGFNLQSYNQEALQFIYNVGNDKTPSVFEELTEQLRSNRDPVEDMLIVFGCERSQIAHNASELRPDTKAYVGQLVPGLFDRLQEHNIEHVYTSFPEGKIRRQQVEIGGKTKEQLQQELKQKGYNVSYYAEDMIKSPDFTTLPVAQTLDTVRLTVRDLGLTHPTTDQVYKKAQELGLDLCPPELGLHYRLQYDNQPLRESLDLGMQQFTDSRGYPDVFSLLRSDDGLWLVGVLAPPDRKCWPHDEFVFCLRKSEPQNP